MTYCCALRLKDGLVFVSDTRTNAGLITFLYFVNFIHLVCRVSDLLLFKHLGI